jgi:glycosyltransferase involved in cell wall biosynthesis
LAARSAKIPVILHFHNQGSISGNNLNYAIARKVFLCSAAQSGEITNFDRIKDKSIVLHNAVDTRVFANGHAIRDEIGIMKNDLAVGTIAQISHRKGIDLFLDTAERLIGDYPNLKFVIVGPSAVREDAYSKSIMERIQNPPLKGIVIYLGSRTDIPNILASLDIFFLPTRAEPFGMVVIEAMAAGVPVVASAVGGIPEIITRSDIGSAVSTLTAEAYAKAIRELLQLGGALKDVGELGRQSLVGRFDLAKMRHTLSAVYEELVQR